MHRQLGSLIEATTKQSSAMQRNGHDTVRAAQDVGTRPTHQRGERVGKRPPPLVFERVHNRAEVAGVRPDRAAGDHIGQSPNPVLAAVAAVRGVVQLSYR